jgi:hypothetical protein
LVLLRTPQGDFTAASGTTQLNTKNPPRADTHFRIASNTKTMTAAVIMQLAQESKLGLNDPVSKYVPGVPNGDNVAIAQLLEMRSGLYNYTNDPIISATIDTDPAKVWTPAELLAIAFAHPPIFPPGRRGVDLISDALPFGALWYGEPNAISNAIGYANSVGGNAVDTDRASRVTASVLGYGVGSEMDAPKMSLLPKVAGQSLFGAGFGRGLPVSKDWR